MQILLIAGYYYPEQVGAGIWVRQLALDLKAMGHEVSVLTAFPSYPQGRIFDEYRGRWFQTERIDGIEVTRTFTFATSSKSFWPRIASFASFCVSSLLGGLWRRKRFDVVYAVLPPLPLGVSAALLAKAARASLVVNVQDIYPDIAVALGILRQRHVVRFFQAMERWVYRHSNRIVVISEGFRQNLLNKGVPGGKLAVVPNWGDPEMLTLPARQNAFRREHHIGGEFVVLYSGGLSHNSHLEPVLEAAEQLQSEPFLFLIAGEGVHKPALTRRVETRGLRNVRFLPFQPLARYGEMLAAADITLVTLHAAATVASVPSKIYKQMAAGRPVIALADARSEVARLIAETGCGICAGLQEAGEFVAALRFIRSHPGEAARMGAAGRRYVEEVCSRSRCVAAIEQVCAGAMV
jgi:colanic acid biosynthesis glycosyl transferase WcaI